MGGDRPAKIQIGVEYGNSTYRSLTWSAVLVSSMETRPTGRAMNCATTNLIIVQVASSQHIQPLMIVSEKAASTLFKSSFILLTLHSSDTHVAPLGL